MKRTIFILAVSLGSLSAFGQKSLHRKAEKCFHRFEFASAALIYEKIVKKNPADHNALLRLEQCNRFLSYKSDFKALLPTKKNQSSVNLPFIP